MYLQGYLVQQFTTKPFCMVNEKNVQLDYMLWISLVVMAQEKVVRYLIMFYTLYSIN